MDLKQVRKLLHGQSVAVVGNASSGLRWSRGEAIDDHDLVVRFNTGLPGSQFTRRSGKRDERVEVKDRQTAFGMRTSVMAGNYFSRLLWIESGEPIIWYVRTKRCKGRQVHEEWADPTPHVYEVKPREELLEEVGRPSCGVIVLDFILARCEPREVRLYGFDFFKSPTWYWAFIATSPHNGRQEEDWVRRRGFKREEEGVWGLRT